MIEQIIEKVLKKYPFAVKYTSGDREIVDFDYHRKELGSLKIDLVLEFSSYNKQLLDEIEGEMLQIAPTHSTREYRDMDKLRDDILSTLNKYRV